MEAGVPLAHGGYLQSQREETATDENRNWKLQTKLPRPGPETMETTNTMEKPKRKRPREATKENRFHKQETRDRLEGGGNSEAEANAQKIQKPANKGREDKPPATSSKALPREETHRRAQ